MAGNGWPCLVGGAEMIHMDTTKIIVIGLVAMGAVSVLGYYICMFAGLNPTIEPTISLITGLFSAIGVVTGATVAKGDKSKILPEVKEKEGEKKC